MLISHPLATYNGVIVQNIIRNIMTAGLLINTINLRPSKVIYKLLVTIGSSAKAVLNTSVKPEDKLNIALRNLSGKIGWVFTVSI